jgi:hypothetical protein
VGSTQEYNHYTHNPFQLDFYRVSLSKDQLAGHFLLSKEGEEVGVFTWEQLNAMGEKFSPFHRMLAEKHGVWKKK